MRASVTAALITLAGCSAVIDPDTGLLGDESEADMGPVVDSDGGGVDAGPSECPGGCDDGVACTTDRCVDGRCLQAPDDSLCASGERCDPVSGCVPERCTTDAECGADGIACNGIEACVSGTCQTSPGMSCDDGNPCTTDSCGGAGCTNTPVDLDGDGAPAMGVDGVACPGGTDCADDDSGRRPGATEVCDTVDQDCDGAVDEGVPMCDGGGGDTCGDLVALTLDSAGFARHSTRIDRTIVDDYSTPCGGGGGRDIVLAVDFNGIADFVIDTTRSSIDTVVAASTDCGRFSVGGRGCNDDIDYAGGVAQSRLWVHRIGQIATPNRLFIMVEGYDGDAVGDVVVDVRRTDAVSDACDRALNISAGGSVLGFAGNGSGFTGDARGSCQGFSERFAPEGSFVVEPRRRALDLVAYSDAFDPDVYVRLTCAPDDELICVSGSGPQTTIDQMIPLDFTPDDVNVFVDGGSSGNPYTLDYTP